MLDTDRATVDRLLLRLQVEEFLAHEAALLDEWRLDEWADLFTDDGQYVIPATDNPSGDAATSLVLVGDDLTRIRGRVARLNSRRAHREFPWSRTRRLITNVRVTEGDKELAVDANFAVYRIRNDLTCFIGRYRYRLRRDIGSFKIRERRVELDLETLRPHGTVSIVL